MTNEPRLLYDIVNSLDRILPGLSPGTVLAEEQLAQLRKDVGDLYHSLGVDKAYKPGARNARRERRRQEN